MDYFLAVKNTSPIPRVHPLLLSLTEAFKNMEVSRNISSISEDDPRVLENDYYTMPETFPPLDIHSSSQNGMYDQHILSYTEKASHSHRQLTAENACYRKREQRNHHHVSSLPFISSIILITYAASSRCRQRHYSPRAQTRGRESEGQMRLA